MENSQDLNEFIPHAEKGSEESVQSGPGLALQINSTNDVMITQSVALAIVAGKDVEVTNGGSLALVAGGDCKATNGGAMLMVAGRNTEVTNGGAWTVVSRQVTARGSIFGILLSNQTHLEEGSRVMLNTPQAIAFGAALGATFALMNWLLKRK